MITKLFRPQVLARDIVIVDGISSSGKSLIAPLLSTLKPMQIWQINEWYEYVLVAHRLGRITPDAAKTFLQIFADLDLYNIMIGRKANFRTKDITGLAENLMLPEFKKRINAPDGDCVVEKIKKERPILQLMTHYIFGNARMMFDAWGERLKMIVLPERHPALLALKWHEGYKSRPWGKRMGVDPRDVQLVVPHGKGSVPWFAASWAARYQKMKPLEQALAVVGWFLKDFERSYRNLKPAERKRVYKIPFEKYVVSPDKYIAKIRGQLGLKTTPLTNKMKRKLNLPRAGTGAEISEAIIKLEKAARAEKLAPPVLRKFELVCRAYENSRF